MLKDGRDRSPVDTVRRSVASTREAGTAYLRYERLAASFKFSESVSDQHAGLASFLQRVENAGEVSRGSTLRGPAGRIDFGGDRCIFWSAHWNLFVRGDSYIGEPGEWELDEAGDTLADGEPFWLLALVSGTVEAADDGAVSVAGSVVRQFRGLADYDLARELANRPMAPPAFSEGLDLARLPIDVWLDDDGRIRKAAFHGSGRREIAMELSGFGQAAEVEPPEPDEILADEE